MLTLSNLQRFLCLCEYVCKFVCTGGERSESVDGREGEKLMQFKYLMFLFWKVFENLSVRTAAALIVKLIWKIKSTEETRRILTFNLCTLGTERGEGAYIV